MQNNDDRQPPHSLAPDEDMMLDHLLFWFGDVMEGQVEIGWKDGKTGKLNKHQFFDVADLEDAAALAAKVNSVPGQDVYYRISTIKNGVTGWPEDKDFQSSAGVWVDLDDDGAASNAKNIYSECKPNGSVVTGRKPHLRAQLLWKADDTITDPDLIRQVNVDLADLMQGDSAVINPVRFMRLGGSVAWPWKEGRVPELTQFKQHKADRPGSWPVEALARAFKKRAPETPQAGEPIFKLSEYEKLNVDGLIQEIMQQKPGTWHHNVLRLVGSMISSGNTDGQILLTAPALTWPGYNVQDTVREMQGMIRAGREKWGVPNPDSVTDEPSSDYMDDFAPIEYVSVDPRTIPLMQWVMGDMLQQSYVSLLVSPGGIGKSTFTIMCALAIITGKHLCEKLHVHRPGKVWMYNAEDDLPLLTRRIEAMKWHMGITDDEIKGKLYVNTGDNNMLRVARADASGNVLANPCVEKMVNHIKRNDIKVLIIDPFVETYGGSLNENSNDHIKEVAKQFRDIAKQANCAVWLVHHTRKAANGFDGGVVGNMDAARGAGALTAMCRIVHTLYFLDSNTAAKMGVPDEERVHYVRLDGAKANLSLISPDAQWFKRVTKSLENNTNRLENPDTMGVLEPTTLDHYLQDQEDEQAAQTISIFNSLALHMKTNKLPSISLHSAWLAIKDMRGDTVAGEKHVKKALKDLLEHRTAENHVRDEWGAAIWMDDISRTKQHRYEIFRQEQS